MSYQFVIIVFTCEDFWSAKSRWCDGGLWIWSNL